MREQAVRGLRDATSTETEFTPLKSTSPLEVVNARGSCNTSNIFAASNILEEIAGALATSGIELQNFHSEGTTAGQVTSSLVP